MLNEFLKCFDCSNGMNPHISLLNENKNYIELNVSDVQSVSIEKIEKLFHGVRCFAIPFDGENQIKILVSKVRKPNIPFKLVDLISEIHTQRSQGVLLGIGDLGFKYFSQDKIIHSLVSGASGYGKSSFFRCLLFQTLINTESFHFVVDPKRVDYSFLKHYKNVGAVVDCNDEWIELFTLLLIELSVREYIFSKSFLVPPNCLSDYIQLRNKYSANHLPEFKKIFLWIDEFHMLHSNSGVLHQLTIEVLSKIARKGRAFGVHLMMSCQSINDIPHSIRDQVNVSFDFYSHASARKHEDANFTPRAAKLENIKGRFLFCDEGLNAQVTIQAPYATNEEINELIFAFCPIKKIGDEKGLFRLQFEDEDYSLYRMVESLQYGIGIEKFMMKMNSKSFQAQTSGLSSNLNIKMNKNSKLFPIFHDFNKTIEGENL